MIGDFLMRATLTMLAAAGGLTLAGCTMAGGAGASTAANAPEARAALVDAAGAPKGSASFRQTAGGIEVSVTANGLAPGPKGLHLHMTGRCDAPDFTTAGGHWNPTARKHGTQAPMGPHLGDIPNLMVAADGNATMTAVIAGARLRDGATPLLDADGATLMIHAAADDYRTDPSGNSGARIVCGVVTAA
jgi:Cu-Zn family superoxide dismutase